MSGSRAIFHLDGHVALITGGNGGLGLSMARGLVKAGATIALWGRNADKNDAAVGALTAMGGTAAGFVADVTDPRSAEAAFAETIARFGRIDSCFANAGGSGARGPFTDLSTADWTSTVDLNLISVATTFRLASRHWVATGRPGKLIVTSSVAAVLGIPMGSAYSTTKAAVTGLVRALAIELGPAGIQVNALLPGFIETEMSLKTPAAFQEACQRRSASGKIGTLEDMEGIAVFLAAPESRFMTGQAIILDGGHSIFPM